MATVNQAVEQQARKHQESLTKPLGALGKLEDIACWFAARQGKVLPDKLVPHIVVFAGDHGVIAEGVSAYPGVVTTEMVKNFVRGGAAINVLARQCGASLSIVNVGVASDISEVAGVVQANVAKGTANLLHEAAMTEAQCAAAIAVGRAEAKQGIAQGANVLIAGDMGIGNTTASACVICKLTGAEPEMIVGAGTGVDDKGLLHKVSVVRQALQRVKTMGKQQTLHQVGGLEIAAMVGFYLQAAESGVPVIIDGFIASAAALAAKNIEMEVTAWMLGSHCSEENGHALALDALGLDALFDLKMRLGEGSGATLLVPLLNSAIALHNDMATFEAAGVSHKDG